MKYMLLIYGDESQSEEMMNSGSAAMDAVMAEYFALNDALEKAGALGPNEPLHPTSAATTVRVRNGKTVTTSGPFAETKEQLGGFYIIDVADLDQAIAWAAKVPGAKQGSVEVRPIAEM